jgi:hypothetical protein
MYVLNMCLCVDMICECLCSHMYVYVSVYVRICMYLCMFLSSDTCCVCSHMICYYIIIFVKLFAGNIFVYIIYIICSYMLFMLYVFGDCGICCMCVRTCVIICINSNNMKAFVLISIESQRNKRKQKNRVSPKICTSHLFSEHVHTHTT